MTPLIASRHSPIANLLMSRDGESNPETSMMI